MGDAYRRFHGIVTDKPTNFGWVVEGKLAGCGLPVSQNEFEWIIGQGIKSIVTVREVPLPTDWFNDSEIEYLHLAVEDFGAPNMEELIQAVDFLDKQFQSDRPAMVHCAAGKGRTGTVLAAYLVKNQNLSADQAIEKLRNIRPGSVQSISQETAVSMYEKYVKNKK